MRKFLYYSLLCLLWISVVSCKDEDVSAPAQTSFTVDKTSGLSGTTVFTFKINQASAQTISLLPYGEEKASLGGILIPASSFTNGVAEVKFTYGTVGVFNAVVRTNNHSGDGSSVKNTVSSATTITITSNKNEISAFNLGTMRSASFNEKVFTALSTKTTIDQAAKTIDVIVKYALAKDDLNASYFTDLTKLVPTFTVSDSSKVSVNGVVLRPKNIVDGIAQVATIPTIDFSSPVNFVVKAYDGTTTTYKVTVTKTPVETKTTLKSFSGIAGKKSANERAMSGYVDNANKRVIIYDVYGTSPLQFDSMKVKYELDGEFAVLKQDGKKFDASKKIFDLTPSKPFEVFSQDSLTAVTGKATYDVYAVAAPKLELSLNTLNPPVTGTTEDFTVKLNVLTGTDLSSQTISGTLTLPAGASVTSVTIGGVTVPVIGTSFTVLGANLEGTPKAELTVNMGTYTYKVVYAVSVTILK